MVPLYNDPIAVPNYNDRNRVNTTLISMIAAVSYFAIAALLAVRMFGRLPAEHALARLNKQWLILVASGAASIHALVLYVNIFAISGGLNFGFFNAISLMTWLVASLLLIAAVSKPVESLGVIILPSAAIALLLEQGSPASHILLTEEAADLRYHIIISILAYSMLSIAALQSILLAIQNRYLRAKHPGGFIRAFPPLETMESMLFQMIGIGFAFLTLSLLTGLPQIDDMFAQHQVHKTILSLLAWGFFAVLLWGRWRFGWRGRTAVRWVLAGFIVLLLAYFGVKLVKELLLGR